MFVCTQCQKEYETVTKFCGECGGKVEEKIEAATVYACANCHREYPAGIKFCGECGGKIEAQIPVTEVACSQCGKVYDETVKFCGECGGKIAQQTVIKKSAVIPAATVSAAPVQAASDDLTEKAISQIVMATGNPMLQISYSKRTENIYAINIKNQLLIQTAEFIIENNGNSSCARLINSKTAPSVLCWVFMVICFYFFPLIYFLVLKPLYAKLAVSIVNNVNAALKHPYAYIFPDTPAFDPRGKSAAEIADICFSGMPQMRADEMRLGYPGAFDTVALNGALASYAVGVSPENIIFMIDHTPAGMPAGSCGVIFAFDRIYYSFRVLKSVVGGNSGYENVTGSACANGSVGKELKYNVLLSNVDPKNVIALGMGIAAEPSGEIPERISVLMEKVLVLISAMKNAR